MQKLNIPKHVAIIMDGNGRWAKRRAMPRNMGHRAGSKTLKKIVEDAADLGIEVLTVYAFSTENWTRPKDEVDYLMKLIGEFFLAWVDDLTKEQIKVTFMGEIDSLPSNIIDIVNKVKNKTKDHKRFTLNIALNYGSQNEILTAVKKIIKDKVDPNTIDEELFSSYLSTSQFPKIDLMIRTSGEKRLSNFLLWELAYTEFYFSNLLWPDFNKDELLKAIKEFSKRERRFGGLL